MRYFFKDNLKLSPYDLSLFDSISSFVFLAKPIYGFISDSYPVCGSRRKFYIILCSVLQMGVWLALSNLVNNFWGAVFAQMANNITSGFMNVIGDGLMVELSQK